MSSPMVERIARIISPQWFAVENGVCGLDNYPEQHKRYQDAARQRAREILAAVLADLSWIEDEEWRQAYMKAQVEQWQIMIDAALKENSDASDTE